MFSTIFVKDLARFIRDEARYPLLIGSAPGFGVVNICLSELGSASYLNMSCVDTIDFNHHIDMHWNDPMIMDEIDKINLEVEPRLASYLATTSKKVIATCRSIDSVPLNITKCMKYCVQILDK